MGWFWVVLGGFGWCLVVLGGCEGCVEVVGCTRGGWMCIQAETWLILNDFGCDLVKRVVGLLGSFG